MNHIAIVSGGPAVGVTLQHREVYVEVSWLALNWFNHGIHDGHYRLLQEYMIVPLASLMPNLGTWL